MEPTGELLRALFQEAGLSEYGTCDFDPALCRLPSRKRLPPGARSLVMAAVPYYVGRFPHRNVSRYAMVQDYHTVSGALLERVSLRLREAFPGEQFLALVDASPIDEVEAGRRAGLGVRGLHGQLINETYGSYIFIGAIVSTVRFPPSRPKEGGCLRCGRCLAACPTGALNDQGLVRGRCRSHLTQKKKLTDPEERAQIAAGGMAWGCDICTDCCPMNRGKAYSGIPDFYRNICAVVRDTNLDAMIADRAYAYKGQAVLRRNLGLIEHSAAPDAHR